MLTAGNVDSSEHSKEIITSFMGELSKEFPLVKVSIHTVSEFLRKKPTRNLLFQTVKNDAFQDLIRVFAGGTNLSVKTSL